MAEKKKKASPKKKATPKKVAKPKPKPKAVPKGPSKAGLASSLKDKGIPLPVSGEASDMEHRLKHWKSGMGYMVRLHRNAGGRFKDHPLSLLDSPRKALYWLPDSEMADMILMTKLIVPVKRGEPLNNAVMIGVPEGFDGSDNGADS